MKGCPEKLESFVPRPGEPDKQKASVSAEPNSILLVLGNLIRFRKVDSFLEPAGKTGDLIRCILIRFR